MLEGRTLWELIEERAEATPDAAHGRRRERPGDDVRASTKTAPSGPPPVWPSSGIGAGDVITWQLPTWLESMVLVGGHQPARARSRTRSCHIYREREVGFCVQESGAKLHRHAQRVRRASTSRAWPTAHRRRARRVSTCSCATARCPRATRPTCPRRPPMATPCAGFLHVGHHGRSEGRPAHRPHDQRRGQGHGAAARGRPTPIATPWPSRSRTSAASPGCARA